MTSCTHTDYEDKIIERWEIDKFKVEFEGTPDPEAKTTLAPFNVGITFFKDGTCKGIEPTTSNHSANHYYIGSIFDGNYELDGEMITINDRVTFEIIALNETTLKMDLFLTLEDYNHNYAHLRKLKEQGTGENLIIHYTYRKQQ